MGGGDVRGNMSEGGNVQIPNDHWIVHYTVGLSVPPSVHPSVRLSVTKIVNTIF